MPSPLASPCTEKAGIFITLKSFHKKLINREDERAWLEEQQGSGSAPWLRPRWGPAPGLAGKPTGHVWNSTERKNKRHRFMSGWDPMEGHPMLALRWVVVQTKWSWCAANPLRGQRNGCLSPASAEQVEERQSPHCRQVASYQHMLDRDTALQVLPFAAYQRAKQSHTQHLNNLGEKKHAHRYIQHLPELITCWEKTPQLQEDVSVMSFGCTHLW